MMDRECKSCAYSSPSFTGDNGCTAWECEYISRAEAIEAWKKLHEQKRSDK